MLRRLFDLVGFTAAVPSGAGESACRFVSSRGILRSCDAHARRPRSSQGSIPRDLSRVVPTARVVYLCTDMVPQFVREHLPRRRGPFTLVTGDSYGSYLILARLRPSFPYCAICLVVQ